MPRVYSSARNKILDATERVILRDGPHGVSVDAVLAESGMSKGGFFHHFPTKAALLGGLLERLSRAVAATAATSMRGAARLLGRSLRAQIAIAFDLPPAKRKHTRALVLALLAGVMESEDVAAQARKANRDALKIASGEGVDRGAALCVQLALDGYILGEAFKTMKLKREDREALRATLYTLVDTTSSTSAASTSFANGSPRCSLELGKTRRSSHARSPSAVPDASTVRTTQSKEA
jgi:AcrR family transcriptional regulator